MRHVLVFFVVLGSFGGGFLFGNRVAEPACADSVSTTAKQCDCVQRPATQKLPPLPTVHAPSSSDSAPSEEVEALRTKLAFQQYVLDGAQIEFYGKEEPWPDMSEENAAFGPDVFRQAIADAIADCASSVDLVDVECEEPPCIAALRPNGEDWMTKLVNECPHWSKRYGRLVTMSSFSVECGDHDEGVVLLSPYWAEVSNPADEERRKNHGRRLNTRWAQLRAAWECKSSHGATP